MHRQREGRGRAVAQWRRLAAVAAGVVLVGFAACDDEDDATGPNAEVEEQRAFIDGIVPHHEIANMRADEALAKAVHPGLRTIAQRMKEDQGREISQYKAIRQQLLGSSETPAPMMPMPIPAGPEFDREWMLMMINHHQGAIDLSTLAHGSNVQSTLDSLAHHTIEEQREEQQEFRDSIAVWYGTR